MFKFLQALNHSPKKGLQIRLKGVTAGCRNDLGRVLLSVLLVSTSCSALASSATCTNCHQAQVAAWSDSDHAWAMRLPETVNVKAPFQGEALTFDGLEGVFDQSDRASADDAVMQRAVLGSGNGVGPIQFLMHLRDTKAGQKRHQWRSLCQGNCNQEQRWHLREY